jgi:hypothetical protein
MSDDALLAVMVESYNGGASPYVVIHQYGLTSVKLASLLVGLRRNSVEYRSVSFFNNLSNCVSGLVFKNVHTVLRAPSVYDYTPVFSV